MAPDISCNIGGSRFNLRTTAVVICDGHVLVMKTSNTPYYYTPGGRVRANESSKDAFCREMEEELGVTLYPQRLLWICESFFTEETTAERFHEIGFYYLVELPENHALYSAPAFTRTDDEGVTQHFRWQSLSELSEIDLRPAFLKERILHLPDTTECILDDR